MRISREPPELLPRGVLWALVVIALAVISVLRDRIGLLKAEILTGIVLLAALLVAFFTRSPRRPRGQ
jgi:hypothetical protein